MGFNFYDDSNGYEELRGLSEPNYEELNEELDDNDEEWAKSFPPLYEEFFD